MHRLSLLLLPLLILACPEPEMPATDVCPESPEMANFGDREFRMGFSSWSFGPEVADLADTYDFIGEYGDIISEQVDQHIPWAAWSTGAPLPREFVDNIAFRAARRPAGHRLVLSVSLLNSERNELLDDYDGSIPTYTSLADTTIENAYYRHLDYLIASFRPDYLVMAMEVNNLRVADPAKWVQYRRLSRQLRTRLRAAYPDLPLSESVTLHEWYDAEVAELEDYQAEIRDFIGELDFAAISFYPFFNGLHSRADFQEVFDFLHERVSIPTVFVETSHLAEALVLENFNLTIAGDPCEQRRYLETLLLNARDRRYPFVIWWAHRDYDRLWATFPAAVRDLGRIWRDTGLLDEDGRERPAFRTWEEIRAR